MSGVSADCSQLFFTRNRDHVNAEIVYFSQEIIKKCSLKVFVCPYESHDTRAFNVHEV